MTTDPAATSAQNDSMALSSARWRRGWCASAMKKLLSNHALKPLVPTLCLAVVVIYGLADKLRNFVAGIFIPQYHYPYAVALCFAQSWCSFPGYPHLDSAFIQIKGCLVRALVDPQAGVPVHLHRGSVLCQPAGFGVELLQVLISLLVLNLLHVLGLVPLQHYCRSLGERVLVPSICNSIHAVLTMWAKASSSNAGLFPLVLPLLPIATVAFSFWQKLASPPPPYIAVLVSILGGTSFAITASQGLSGVHALEYMYAPLALILHSLSLTWLTKVSEDERCHSLNAQASIFDIYYTQLVNQSWVLGLLWLLHPNSPWQVLSHSSWQTLLFHGYLLSILLLGMVLNFLVGMSALCVSPLAAALLHSARQLMLPLLQLW